MAKRRSPARKDPLFRRLQTAVRQEDLIKALDQAKNQKAFAVFQMLCDPAYRNHSLARLCEKAGLSFLELVDLFRVFRLDEALLVMLTHVPQVMEDTAISALNKTVVCEACAGSGQTDGHACTKCVGQGQIMIPGDPQAQRLVFEAVGLTGKNKVPYAT